MKLKVLGSSSSGNCYLLENDKECLVIEAGISLKEVKVAVNFDISKIVGVIATHKHRDHAGRVKEFENAGIRTFKPYICEETANQTMKFGNFTIKAFPNRTSDGKWLHDNSDGSECPCYGFWIHHPDMGKLVYASDTECVVQKFKDLNHILVEANYSQDLVDQDSVKFAHQVQGHMSIDTAYDFLKANKSSSLRSTVLCHLSGDCADAENFKDKAQSVVDSSVYVARKGLEVDLRLELF